MKQIRMIIIFFVLLLLSACWDSVELDDSIMVVGIGISKHKDKYKIVVEATAPSNISEMEKADEGDSILLETTSATLFDAARDIIQVAKRRLYFTHAEVWVIHDELAADEDMLAFLDILRREKMLRLNSYIFVSDIPPKDIFSTEYTFSSILSEELVSGVEYEKYISNYPTVKSRDFFKMMLSPLRTGFLPTITTVEQNGNILSELTGAAIFNKGKMVGRLNADESAGLMWLNGEVEGGSITVSDDDMSASFKLINGNLDLETHLSGEDLTVHVHIKAEGSLADQYVHVTSMNEWTKKFETIVSEEIKQEITQALQKLQGDFKTDATAIGIHTYRRQVHDFNKVKDNWDDVFSNASIEIDVETRITDKGLIESPGYQSKEQKYERLYQFKKED